MKSLIQAAAVAALLALPVASFAQSNAPVTRAEVNAQLVQLEKAGYSPAADHTQYPAGIQAAEARIDQQDAASRSYGGVADGTTQSGSSFHPQYDVGMKSIYLNH